MSLTISPLSALLQSSVNSQILSSLNAATSTSDPNSIAAVTTAALGDPTSGTSTFATDLASLFKDLASNDVSAAQTDLTQLEKDLGTSATSSSSTTDTPLQKLFASLSTSLSNGDTTAALQTLASFFVQTGNPTGNAVNTTA